MLAVEDLHRKKQVGPSGLLRRGFRRNEEVSYSGRSKILGSSPEYK